MLITIDSHLDHAGLTIGHLQHLLKLFAGRKTEGVFVETIMLPENLPSLPCALYGPLMGDTPVPNDVIREEVRAPRTWKSRVFDRALRQSALMTIVAGPTEGHPCMLYTVYGGPQAPREPDDPNVRGDEVALKESVKFWAQHALAVWPGA